MTNVFYISRNWESDIGDVAIETCDIDPLGYRAVFRLSGASLKESGVSFRIGASSLAQRARSLALAGYQAPMTARAIALLAGQLDPADARLHGLKNS